jgi:hypothetical protein
MECGLSLGKLKNFFVFTNAGECDTGLYQVKEVRVWKLQCSLGMGTVYNSAVIVVSKLELLY